MDANVKEIIKIKMEACKKALEKNGMKAYLVEDAQAARELVNAMIKDHETVCDGGTMTLQETGILDMLNHRDLVFHSHSDPTMTREQSDAEARKAFSADTLYRQYQCGNFARRIGEYRWSWKPGQCYDFWTEASHYRSRV